MGVCPCLILSLKPYNSSLPSLADTASSTGDKIRLCSEFLDRENDDQSTLDECLFDELMFSFVKHHSMLPP